jgi:hypothetical protein
MSDLLPYVQLVAGTDKGFVDAADRQESALLAGALGDIGGEKRCLDAYYSPTDPVREHSRAEVAPAPVDRGRECRDQQALLRASAR